MKTIQIEYGLSGPPSVSPDPEVCLSGETIVFVISSRNPLMEAVNLAFDNQAMHFFLCPSNPGSRQYRCKIDLEDTGDPDTPRGAVLRGIAPEHTSDTPRTEKYTITPFVVGNVYKDGELDPYIVITKKP